MKTVLFISVIALHVAALSSDAQAQAYTNDNDGLLDVGEAPGFPEDPSSATGGLHLQSMGIGDLGGASLLTNIEALFLAENNITNVEADDFDGLAKLQWLSLSSNSIASIEEGSFVSLSTLRELCLNGNLLTRIAANDFGGLTSLQRLDLTVNPVAAIEPGAFAGHTNLSTLLLRFTELTELDFTGATFEHLEPFQSNIGSEGNDPPSGFSIRDVSSPGYSRFETRIASLILDEAEISQSSFEIIVNADGLRPDVRVTGLKDASLVNLTFTDDSPSSLSDLLEIESLDNVRVDPSLYDLYAAEFGAFAAIAGNTVTVVPEPSSALLLLLAVASSWRSRRSRG